MKTVLDSSPPHVLRTGDEYAAAVAAVAEIDRLLDLDPAPYTPEADRPEWLSLLAEAYDQEHSPTDDSDLSPQDVVDFVLEQRGMRRADLVELMGGRSRVSDSFHGKRDLSKSQIAGLRELLNIPAGLLL